jgi:hypothetical protein
MKKLFFYALIFIAVACNNDDKPVVEEKPAAPLSKSKNSDAFNQSFKSMLDTYYHLKDNFITESDTMIITYAKHLQTTVDSIKLNELKGDAGIIENAKMFTQNISVDLKAILAAKDLLGKRKAFNTLSDNMYNLIKVVQYDREIVYHQHCPMAFEEGDANAYWLSRTSDIKNPFRPTTMLTCGDVADSLNYTK